MMLPRVLSVILTLLVSSNVAGILVILLVQFLRTQKSKKSLAEIDNLERKLAEIQQSTRVIIPQLQPWHEKLRIRFKWYYNWHLKSYSKKIHWGILSGYLLIIALYFGTSYALIGASIITLFFLFDMVKKVFLPKKAEDEIKIQHQVAKLSQNEIEQKLIDIQQSTRASFRPLIPWHEKLRMKFRWYYNWHLNPYATRIHIATLGLYAVSLSVGVIYGIWQNGTHPTQAAQQCSAIASGDWNTSTTWSCGAVPGTNMGVLINSGYTVTMSANSNSIAYVQVGGTLTTNNYTITAGTSGVTLSSGGTINAGSSLIVTTGGWTNSGGTFNSGTSTVKLNSTTASQSIGGTASTTFSTLEINNSATYPASLAINTNAKNLVVDSGGAINASSYTLNLAGDFTNNGTFTASTSTVNFNGATSQQITGSTSTAFYNIQTTTTNTVLNVNTNFSETGTMTVNSGTTVNPAAAVVISGTGALTGSGTTKVTRTSATADFNNQYTMSGTKTLTNLTVNYAGATSQTVSNLSYGNLTVENGTTLTASSSFSVSGTFTIGPSADATFTPDAGVVVSGAGTLTGYGTAQVSRTAATADFSSQYTITNKTLTNLTVEYTAASAQVVSAVSYGHLKISTTAGAVATLTGNTTAIGNLTISSGASLDTSASNFNLTVGGNWDNSGTFTANASTVTLSSTASSGTIKSNGNSFNNLNINNGLAGYWKFDEGTGTSSKDYSGSANNTAFNSTPSWTSSVVNTTYYNGNPNALSFDGVNAFAYTANTAGLGTTNTTLAAWVYLSSSSMHGAFVKAGYTSGYGMGVGSTDIQTNGNNLILLYEGIRWIPTGHAIGTGWHHVAMTINGSGVPEAFIDGSSVGTFSGSTPGTPDNKIYIGGYMGGRNFNGSIDDVRAYTRQLSSTEISTIASGTNPTNASFTLVDNLHANGNLNIVTGAFDTTTSNYTINIGGSFLNATSFNGRSSTITFDSTTTSKTVTTSNQNMANVVFNGAGGGWIPQDNLTATTFTYTEGALHGFNDNGKTITANGNLLINASSYKLDSSGTWIVGANGNIANGNDNYFSTLKVADNVTATKTAAIKVRKIIMGANSLLTGNFQEVMIPTTNDFIETGAGSDIQGSSLAIVNIGTNFTQKAMSFSSTWLIGYTAPPCTITATGNWTTGTMSVFGTNSTAPQIVDMNGYNLTVNGNLTLGLNSASSYYQGKIFFRDGTHTITGNVASGGSVTLGTFDLGVSTVNVGGNLDFRYSSVLDSGSTIVMNSSAAGKYIYTGSQTLGNLTFNNASGGWALYDSAAISGSLTITNSETAGNGVNFNNQNVDVGSNVSIGGGKLTAGSGTINVGGNWTRTAGTFVANTSTIVMDGTTPTRTITSGGQSFNNITFNGSGVAWTLSGNLDVNGNLTITAGTLNANGVGILVAGNWSNSGTFNAQAGAVTFDGTTGSTSVISGNTTFSSFFCSTNDKILSFASGSTQAITSAFTVNGTSGHNIVLSRNGGTGTNQWSINPSGSKSVSYLTVSNANNLSASSINPQNSVDGGNNTNWFTSITITASAGSNGTISPSGSVSVSYGNDEAFTITANSGYYIARILVDGAGITNVLTSPYTYTFTNVITGHTISANFQANGTKVWDGEGADNAWSTGANWSGNSSPISTDNILFNATSTKNSTFSYTGNSGYANLTIDTGYSGTLTIGSTPSFSVNDFVMNAGTMVCTGQHIYFNGSFTINTGTFTPGLDTNFGAAATGKTIKTNGQNLGNVNFNNAAGGWQFNDTATLSALTVTASETVGNGVNFNNQTIHINGDISISGGKLTAGSALVDVAGSWTRTAGTFVANTSGITFDATVAGKTITTGAQSFNNLTFNGTSPATWTFQDNITATNYTHSGSGRVIDNAKTITVNGNIDVTSSYLTSTGTWIQNNNGTLRSYQTLNNFQISAGKTSTVAVYAYVGKLTLGASAVLTGSGYFDIFASGNDFIDQGASAQITIANTYIYMTNTGVSYSQKAFTTTGYLFIYGGNTSTLTMTGNWSTGGMLIKGEYDSSNQATAFNLNTNGYNLTDSGELRLGYAQDCYGSFTGNTAAINFSTGSHSISGDVLADVDNNGCYDVTYGYFNLGSANISIGGNVDLSYIYITNPGTSTVTMNSGTTGKTILSNGQVFNNLTFNNAAGGWQFTDAASMTGNLTITNSETVGNGVNFNNQAVNIDGNVSIAGGKLTAGSSAVTVGGSWTRTAGTFVANTGGTTFNSTAAGKTITSGGQSFNNLTFNGVGGGWTFQDNTTVSGNFTNINGAPNIQDYQFSVAGNFTLAVTTGQFTQNDTGSNYVILTGTSKTIATPTDTYNPRRLKITGTYTSSDNVKFGKIYSDDRGQLVIDGGTLTMNHTFYGFLAATNSISIINGGNILGAGMWYFYSSQNTTIPAFTATASGYLNLWGSAYTFTLGGNVSLANKQLSSYGTTALNTSTYNLTLASLELGDSTTGNLAVNLGSGTHTISGDITRKSSASSTGNTLNLNTSTVNVGGNVNFTGITVTPGTSTVNMTSTAAGKTITSAGQSFNNLTFNGLAGGWTYQDALSVNNDWNLTNGTVTTGGNGVTIGRDFTVANSGTVMHNSGASTITVGRHFSDAGSRFTTDTSTVNMTGTGTLTKGGAFYNISVGYTGQTTTISANSFSTSGTFSVNGGTVNSLGSYIVLQKSTSGTPFVFNAATTITGTRNLYFQTTQPSLTITMAGGNYGSWSLFPFATQNSSVYSLGGAITTTGSIELESNAGLTGTQFNTNNYGITADHLSAGLESRTATWGVSLGSSTINFTTSGTCFDVASNGGTHNYNLGSSSITCPGNLGLSNGTGLINLTPGTSTITMTAGDTGNTIVSAGQSFNNLVFNNAAGGWQFNDSTSLTGNFTITTSETVGNGVNLNNQTVHINGNVLISAGELTAGSAAITVGGSWTKSGGTYNVNTSNITFDATTTGKTITSGGQNFNNVTFNGSGGNWAIQDSLDVNGNLTITAGTLNGNGQGITVSGNWSNTGTYTASAGSVAFDGSGGSTSTISGNTTFSVFSCSTSDKILSFTAGTTQTITSMFSVNGTSGHNIILQRNGASGVWTINPSGSRSVSYVTVSNSTNSAVSAINPSSSVDNGGNTNWFASITITVSAVTNGTISPGTTSVSYGANQAFTITPNSGYYISTVLVDGAPLLNSYGNPYVYTFTNVIVSHTISATFQTNNIKIWDGEGPSNNWSDGLNWTGNTAPVSTDSVQFDGTSTKDSGIDTGASGTIANFSINSGYTGTITGNTSALTMTDLTQNAGTLSFYSVAPTISGNLTINAGNYYPGGTTTFNAGTTGKTIKSSSQNLGVVNFNNASGGWQFNDTATISALTVTASETVGNGVNFNNQTVHINGNVSIAGGKLTAGSAAVDVAGSWTRTAGTFVANTSGVTFDATATGKTITSGGQSFNNLTFDGVGGAWTFQDNTTAANFTLTNGTVNAGATTITTTGNWTNSGGTFNRDTSTVSLTGTGSLTPVQQASFYNLSVASSGQTTTVDSSAQYKVLTIYNTLTLNGGTFTKTGANSTVAALKKLSGQLVFNSPTTISISDLYFYPSSTGTVDIPAGNYGGTGFNVFTNSTGSVFSLGGNVTTTGSIRLSTTATGTSFNTNNYSITSNNLTFTNQNWYSYNYGPLTFNAGSSTINTDIVTAAGAGATPTTHTINMTSSTWNVTGNWNNVNSNMHIALTPGTSTVNMTAADTGNTIVSDGQSFNNLTFNNAAGGWSFSDTASMTGNLTITTSLGSSNGVNFNNQAVNIDGNVAINGGLLTAGSSAVTVGGNWSRTAGTFTANTGSITFDATTTGKTITSGGQNFNNITFNGASGAWTLQDNTTASNLTLTAGTLNAGATTITVSGNWDSSAAGGTFNANTSTVSLTGTGNLATKSLNNSFYNLSCAYSTKTTTITFASFGAAQVNNVLTVNGGTLSHSNGAVALAGTQATRLVSTNASSNISVSYLDYWANGASNNNLTINVGANATFNTRIFLSTSATGVTYTLSQNLTAQELRFESSNTGNSFNTSASNYSLTLTGTNGLTSGGYTLVPHNQPFTVNLNGSTVNTTRIGPSSTGYNANVNDNINYGSATINISDNYTNTYTSGLYTANWIVNAGTSTANFTATATGKTITTAGQSFNNLVFNGTGGGWTLQDNLTTNNITATAGALTDNGKTLTINGNIDFSSINNVVQNSSGVWISNANGNFVGNPNNWNNTLYDYRVADGVTVTRTASNVSSRKLTLGNNSTLTGAGAFVLYNFWSAADSLDMAATATLTNGSIYYYPKNTGVFTQKAVNISSYVAFGFTSNATIRLTGNWTSGAINVFGDGSSTSEATALIWDTNGYNITINGDLSLDYTGQIWQGKVQLKTGTHTVTGNVYTRSATGQGYLDMGSSNLSVGGNIDFTRTTVTSGTSTVTMNAGDTGNTILSVGQSFNNLTFNNAAGGWQFNDTTNLTGNLTITTSETAGNGVNLNNQATNITGNVTISGGKLTAGSSTITVGGNWTGTSGSFMMGTSVAQLNGNGSISNNYTNRFYDVIAAYSAKTTSGSFSIDRKITFNGGTFNASISIGWGNDANPLTIVAGSTINGGIFITSATATTMTVNVPGYTYSGGLQFKNNSGAGTLTYLAQGNITTASLYTYSGQTGTCVFDSGSNTINVSGDLTAGQNNDNLRYGQFNFGASNVTIGGNVYISTSNTGNKNKITLTSGTLQVGGSWTNNDTFVPGTSTVTFTSTAAGKTITTANQPFNNVTFNGAGGGWTLQDNYLDINGNLTFTAGTLTANGKGINIAGNWINNVGTGAFVADTGTVTFDGASPSTSVIGGNTNFYNFTSTTNDKTLSFYATNTTNITGNFNVNGTSGHNIILNSYSPPAAGQWIINPSGARNVSYVTVSYSNNTNASAINPQNSVDSGNNTNWFAVIVITASAGSNGSISPTGSVNVSYGNTQAFTITANSGYYIAGVLIDGAALTSTFSAPYTYTFTNVITGHTISATFVANGTKIWDGEGADNYWYTGANWTGNTSPISTDNVLFNSTSTKNSTFSYSGNSNYANLTIDTGYSGTLTIGSTPSFYVNDFTMNAGSMDCTGNHIYFSGNFTINAGLFTPGADTNFIATTTGKTIKSNGQNLGSVNFNSATGGWQFNDTTTLSALTVTTSETAGNGVNLNNQTIHINGDVSIAGGKLTAGSAAVDVAGSWTRTAGTFVANTSGITFDATATGKTITSGAQSFNNLIFNGAGGAWTFQDNTITGNFTLTNGTVNAGATTITVSGNWDSSAAAGAFSAGTSTVNLTGTGNLNPESGISFYNITAAAATKTTTLLNTLNVSNVLTLGTGTITGSNGINLSGAGTPFVNNGATINITGRFEYLNSGTVNIAAGNYGTVQYLELYPSSNATYNIAGDITIGGSGGLYWVSSGTGSVLNTQNYTINTPGLLIGAGGTNGSATMNFGSSTLNIGNAGVGLAGGGISGNYTMNLNSSTINNTGNWSNINGAVTMTIVPGTSTVNMTASDTDNTIVSNGQTFNNLTFNNAAGRWQFNDAASVVGNLTITASETAGNGVNFNNQAINVDGNVNINGGKLTAGSSAITVGGSWTRTAGTFVANTSGVTFDATATGKTITSGAQNFNNLTFNGTGGAWTLQDNLTATTLTVTAGNLIDNAKTVTVNGNIAIANTSGVLTSTGTWVQNANGTITNPASSANQFKLLQISANVTSTMTTSVYAFALSMGTNAQLNGAYYLIMYYPNDDFLNIASGANISSSSVIEVLPGGARTVNQKAVSFSGQVLIGYGGDAGIIKMTGNWTTGSFNLWGSLGTDTEAKATVLDTNGYNLTVNGNLRLGTNYQNYLARYQSKILAKTGTHTITGDITTSTANGSGGTTQTYLDLGSSTLNIGGSASMAYCNVTPGTSTVNMTSTTTGKTITSSSQAFNNLTFNGTGGAWTLQDAAQVNGNFTITAGTVTLPSSTLTVNGNFANNSGTFAHNNGTVKLTSLSSAATLKTNGSSFYNLEQNNGGGLGTLPTNGLVAYYNMDETSGTGVGDSSGNTNNGTASNTTIATGQYGNGRDYAGTGVITVPDNNSLDFGTGSFSVSVWQKMRDYTYPKTTFNMNKGNAYVAGNPGFEIGHGYSSTGSEVGINDGTTIARSTVAFDSGYQPAQLINTWTQTTYVFDRSAGRIYIYVNGVKQTNSLNISSVTGSINNAVGMNIGSIYGWQTDGTYDDLRIYNRALTDSEAAALYAGQDTSAGVYTLQSDITAANNLTIQTGMLDTGAAGYNVTVAGNFTNNSSFYPRTSTVTLNGGNSSTQVVTGNTNFYNLNASTVSNTAGRTIQFAGGSTQTVSGTFTMTGATGKILTLSSTNTTNWTISPTNYSVDYTTVSRSTSTTSQSLCAQHSTDGLNNVNWKFSTGTTCNTAPNAPASLTQKLTNDTVITSGSWVNQNSIKFVATISDPDAIDTISLCVEKKTLGTGFSNTEDLCGSGVAYSGTGVSASVTISGITDATQYHWQARVKDAEGLYSSWTAFGGGVTQDFGIDTTAPTSGVVNDGTDTDTDVNDGTLTNLSANWSFNSSVSGIQKYEYAIIRTSDNYYWNTSTGWVSGAAWYNNGTSTSVTVGSMNLQTSYRYYFSVKATDNAGNVSTVNSNGQQVNPTLAFSIDNTTITFNNLNPTNSWTDTQTNLVTSSTNAAGGYTVRAYQNQLLTSVPYPSQTIANFTGTWISPVAWGAGTYGFGYTSYDNLIQGSNRFNSGNNYAGFPLTSPGDIVADHTDLVNGTSGPVSNEQFTIRYKVAVPGTQAASKYSTTITYIVTANY